jgi:phosphoglycolate phosphatase
MVGDRAQDVAGAAANGLDCIGVAWGFAPDGELREAGAVEIVHSTEALHDAIGRMDTARTSALAASALAASALAASALAGGAVMAEDAEEVRTDGNV